MSTSYEDAQTASEISESSPSDLLQKIKSHHSKFLQVLSTNIDSLPNKLMELQILTTKNDYDVICVAEIKPKNTNNPLDKAHVGIAGYFLFTNLQDDMRRGIAVYVKATLLVKKGKTATKGQKQIAEENVDTLTFYRNMILGTNVVFFIVHSLFYPRMSYGEIGLFGMAAVIYICCFQFMRYIAKPTFGENGQLFDAGVDLNMHSGVGEHVKDVLIWTCVCQVLSLVSSYLWFLLLLIPGRILWMAWRSIISPWLFQEVPSEDVSEKKQRKLERKMMRR